MDISQTEENDYSDEENYEIQISSDKELEDLKEEHKKVSCPKCPKLFKTKNNLENHIAMVHEGKSKSFMPIRRSERWRGKKNQTSDTIMKKLQEVDNDDSVVLPPLKVVKFPGQNEFKIWKYGKGERRRPLHHKMKHKFKKCNFC